ncbi:hypothetical protein [Nocardia lijiangensis]|uniref:hypothetical protein n=1 Tax=Nocardia lijiangensis TaxID=299618 RepID=UPI003D7182FC
MTDSFMLATRIPMTREDFELWLDTPAPGRDAIANPEAMFDGWFWDGRVADSEWESADVGRTPREFFAERVQEACAGTSTACVVVYSEGALEAYLFDVGYVTERVHTALLLFAAAVGLESAAEESRVLFWAETSGSLREADWRGWLSVLSVGKEGARFPGVVDLSGAVDGLRAVEERFFAMVERLAEDEESWDWDSALLFHTDTPRDQSFVDPGVLA